MRLFNTLTGKVEPFEPNAPLVRLYVCGVTPYDTTHLGHAFTYTMFDVLLRLVEYHGTPVRYVQNVTDVDDPLFERARRDGEPWDELATRQVEQFVEDMAALDARPVDERPYVSREIPGMIAMIRTLEEKGFTYPIGDRLYFRVRNFPCYGLLGNVSREYQIERAKETGNDPNLPGKEDPLDFLLWQPSAPDEPSWDSPWGPGRPGWHIECSAMALRHLGDQIDIHGGGQDLIFPHHASEIAQSESATGKRPFSRFWMHIGLVRLDGAKMSKSQGNLVFTRELLARYPADGIRLYLVDHRYREGWDYDNNHLERMVALGRRLAAISGHSVSGANPRVSDLRRTALDALDDDLNTPAAVRCLEGLADLGSDAGDAIREIGTILGLRLERSA